jgi:hypothetical protein
MHKNRRGWKATNKSARPSIGWWDRLVYVLGNGEKVAYGRLSLLGGDREELQVLKNAKYKSSANACSVLSHDD